MAYELSGQVAIVTGGASGIGASCVRKLVESGASVAIADRNIALAKQVAAEFGDRCLAVEVDVVSEESCDAMVKQTVDRFGRLDIAINAAGIGSADRSSVADVDFAFWKSVIDINLHGVFLSMKAEIGAMLKSGGGSIVNISSILGSVAVVGASAYIAAKHGVVGLTKGAALEYIDKGIRVNAVGPGFVDTALLGQQTTQQRAEIAQAHPIGRMAEPDEMAGVITFLASPEASFITGSYYLADGGYTIR